MTLNAFERAVEDTVNVDAPRLAPRKITEML